VTFLDAARARPAHRSQIELRPSRTARARDSRRRRIRLRLPWAGDRTLSTLALWLRAGGFEVVHYRLALLFEKTTKDAVERDLARMTTGSSPDPRHLARVVEPSDLRSTTGSSAGDCSTQSGSLEPSIWALRCESCGIWVPVVRPRESAPRRSPCPRTLAASCGGRADYGPHTPAPVHESAGVAVGNQIAHWSFDGVHDGKHAFAPPSPAMQRFTVPNWFAFCACHPAQSASA
jgi:hypothetical protein